MDIITIIGLVIAIVAIGVGMVMKGAPLSALNNVPALLIIIAGTIGAVTVATPANELKSVGKLFGMIFGFGKRSKTQPATAIQRVIELAQIARKDGILALERSISEENDPFLAHGMQMIIDGADQELVIAVLSEEIRAMEGRHAAGAQIFTQAGTYAPTLGVLGAVVGLIAALGGLGGDIEHLGAAISAAFVATLLGIFTGYVLWHPMANKLKRISKQEVLIRTIYMEGVAGIAAGLHHNMLRENLLIYVPTSQKSKVSGDSAK